MVSVTPTPVLGQARDLRQQIEIIIDYACLSVRLWGCTMYKAAGAEQRRGAQTIDPRKDAIYSNPEVSVRDLRLRLRYFHPFG